MPEELPAKLLKLAEKLDAVVGNQLPQEAPRNWLRKLDAIEGDRLLRACRKRLESGTLVALTQREGGYGNAHRNFAPE